MHRSSLALALVLVLALSSVVIVSSFEPDSATAQSSTQAQAPSQIDENAPGLAPAIARWAGAPRGHFSVIAPNESELTLTAIVADPDSAQAIDYEILVDGEIMAEGRSEQPDGFGDTVEVTETLEVRPGVHEVCLRIADRLNPGRTVNCRQAATTPPNRGDASVEAAANGVVVSPSNVVVPVISGTTNDWVVGTPCGNNVPLEDGTFIERARIVIDPGHGGSEPGAVSGDIQEKNLNLVVSEVVIEKFEALGIATQITRPGDYRLPIGTRADIAAALAPDAFISIHHNGGSTRRSAEPGTEIFYSIVRPESQRLAAILHEEMFAAASQFEADWVSTVNQGASTRLNDRGTDLFGIHRLTPGIDSIITEFGYLSNPSEAAVFVTPEAIEAQAQSIVDGVLRWWFTEDPGTSLGRVFTDPTSGGTGGFDECVDPSLTVGSVGNVGLSNLDPVTPNTEVETPVTARQSLIPQLSIGVDPALGLR